MAEVALTTEQRAAIQTGIQLGFELDEFLARHPGWPVGAVTEFWNRLAAEINSRTLKPGEYWAIPSEWS